MREGLIGLINSKTPITDLIDDRIYPKILPQGLKDYPSVTYKVIGTTDNPDLNNPSGHDFVSVDFQCYGKTDIEAETVYDTMREELEQSSGTFRGVEITGVQYMPSGADDYLEDLKVFTKQLELRIDYIR